MTNCDTFHCSFQGEMFWIFNLFAFLYVAFIFFRERGCKGRGQILKDREMSGVGGTDYEIHRESIKSFEKVNVLHLMIIYSTNYH